ncbi:MAG: MarR family transcriptional regulator [Candidatus Pacearchaeota archaeon]
MRNKVVGFIILGIGALIGFIIFSFNKALKDILNATCSHGLSCPMQKTINFQTNISLGVMFFVVMIALYLIFFGEEEKIITKIRTIKPRLELKKITKESYREVLNKLNDDEKIILEKIIESEGAIFQSELVDKTNLSKVKVTRVLDKLEGKGLIERRRRGMTNIIILRQTQ